VMLGFFLSGIKSQHRSKQLNNKTDKRYFERKMLMTFMISAPTYKRGIRPGGVNLKVVGFSV